MCSLLEMGACPQRFLCRKESQATPTGAEATGEQAFWLEFNRRVIKEGLGKGRQAEGGWSDKQPD